MAHGGSRPGAGRKPGAITQKTREAAERLAAEGLTPLDFMLQILRDESEEKSVRFEAAKAAAPFVHPKLSSIEAKVEADVSADITGIEWRVVDPSAPAT